MHVYGLWSQCRILGVYAADLVSIALVAESGKTTRDDLVIQLQGVQCNTVLREVDPPLTALKLYAPDAEGGRTNKKEPGPCPDGRKFVQQLARRYRRQFVHVPNAGTGWLDSLSPGNKVPGNLYLYVGPVLFPTITECLSISDELVRTGHGTPRGKRAA